MKPMWSRCSQIRWLRQATQRLFGTAAGSFRYLRQQDAWRRTGARVAATVVTLAALLMWAPAGTAQTPAGQAPNASQIRSDLQNILRQPEFSPESQRTSPLAKPLEQIRDRIEKAWKVFTDWLDKTFRGRTGSLGSVGTGIAYTLIATLVALGVLTLIRVIKARDKKRGPTPQPTAPITPQTADDDPPNAPPGEWIAEAARQAATGDYRAAFRAVFIAVLLELDRTGRIEYKRSRTNGDYLWLLRSLDLRALYDLLGPLTRDFDRHWYGNHPATEADYERTLAVYRGLPALDPGARTVAPPTARIPTGGASKPERRG